MSRDGKKSGGTKFKKGQSGNPKGRPPLPPDLKQVKIMTQVEFRARASRILEMDAVDLQDIRDDQTQNNLDRIIANIIHGAVILGDYQRTEFLLNRIIGKVPDKLETENLHFVEMVKELEMLSDEDLARQAEEALVIMRGKK